MRVLRQNLVNMTNAATETLNTIGRDHEEDGQYRWDTIFAPWEARLIYMVETNSGVLDGATQQQIQAATVALADIRNETQQKCIEMARTLGHVDSILIILGEEYIDFPIATAPTPSFPGVPIARAMMTLSKSVERAAIQQIISLKNKNIDDIVRQWVVLLEAHVGMSDRMRGVGYTVWMERTKADLLAIKTVLFQVKRDENLPATQGGQPTKDERLAGMRSQIRSLVRNDQGAIGFLRGICRGEHDDEEFETIMRIPFEAPPGPLQQNV